jgi:hypothetical protein
MDAGELSSGDVYEAARLLSIFYGPGQRAPGELVRLSKDAITFTTLGFNPFATLTQLGDLFINTARFGGEAVKQLLPGQAGKVAADAYNAGVRELSSEIRTQQGMARVVRRGLRQFGFEALDKKFSSTGTKAAYNVRRKQVRDNPTKARRELDELFGTQGAVEVMDDLNAGVMSDRIAALVANDVADVRPQGGLDMPVAYSKFPNGRLAYSLLSWSINQMNFVRNNALALMERGAQRNDPAMIGRGAKQFALMTALFALGGGTAGTLKDAVRSTISGEPFDPVTSFEQHAAAGAIPLGLSGKFLIEGLQTGRKGVLDTLPASSLVNQAASGVVKFATTGELSALMKGTTIGRNLHDLATGVNLISDVEAGTRQFAANQIRQLDPHAQAQLQQELAEREAGIELPEGSRILPPELSADQLETQELQRATVREIEREQQQGIEQPVKQPVEEKSAEEFEAKTRESIKRHEGKGKPELGDGVAYNDSKGLRTVGYGVLMEKQDKNGKGTGQPVEEVKKQIQGMGLNFKDVWDGKVALNDDQMDVLFDKHYKKAEKLAKGVVPNYKELPEEAQSILTEMVFQMGFRGVRKFKNMRIALEAEDYLGAYHEMLDSKWAREDSPGRAEELALRMLNLEE